MRNTSSDDFILRIFSSQLKPSNFELHSSSHISVEFLCLFYSDHRFCKIILRKILFDGSSGRWVKTDIIHGTLEKSILSLLMTIFGIKNLPEVLVNANVVIRFNPPQVSEHSTPLRWLFHLQKNSF